MPDKASSRREARMHAGPFLFLFFQILRVLMSFGLLLRPWRFFLKQTSDMIQCLFRTI